MGRREACFTTNLFSPPMDGGGAPAPPPWGSVLRQEASRCRRSGPLCGVDLAHGRRDPPAPRRRSSSAPSGARDPAAPDGPLTLQRSTPRGDTDERPADRSWGAGSDCRAGRLGSKRSPERNAEVHPRLGLTRQGQKEAPSHGASRWFFDARQSATRWFSRDCRPDHGASPLAGDQRETEIHARRQMLGRKFGPRGDDHEHRVVSRSAGKELDAGIAGGRIGRSGNERSPEQDAVVLPSKQSDTARRS